MDSLPEQAYDDVTYLAAQICETPISLISFIDQDRQWFKSCFGFSFKETPRHLSFCAHAILQPQEMMVIKDATQDDRFSQNPLTWQDPKVIFYAGVPLVTEEGYALGTLCVVDNKPGNLSDSQAKALSALARQVMALLVLRKKTRELEQAQAKERELHELRSQFVNMVSHEFRTPLTTIGLSADTIAYYATLAAKESRKSIERHTDVIINQVTQLTKLMNGVLSLGKGDAGKITVSPRSVDAVCWCQGLLADHFGQRPDQRKVCFAVEGRPDRVSIDPDLMGNVVINLLSNAFKFSEIDPHLILRFTPTHLIIQIVDEGIGIPARDMPFLFTPFYRAGNATAVEGTGLGLAIARQLVELHGGTLQIDSQPNLGTTCTIRIPVG
ncbi:GAF domain-containing sensor histidine kinase [Spirosoma aerophilum]